MLKICKGVNIFQLSQTDELFHIDPKQNAALTNENEINNTMQESAQELLNHFVRIQGLNCSQVNNFSNTLVLMRVTCLSLDTSLDVA